MFINLIYSLDKFCNKQKLSLLSWCLALSAMRVTTTSALALSNSRLRSAWIYRFHPWRRRKISPHLLRFELRAFSARSCLQHNVANARFAARVDTTSAHVHSLKIHRSLKVASALFAAQVDTTSALVRSLKSRRKTWRRRDVVNAMYAARADTTNALVLWSVFHARIRPWDLTASPECQIKWLSKWQRWWIVLVYTARPKNIHNSFIHR